MSRAICMVLFALVSRCCVGQSYIRFESQHAQMGTEFNLVFYAPDSAVARAATADVWALIDTLNAHLSDYDPASELSELAQKRGKTTRVTVDFWRVLRAAKAGARRTDGYFDPTCGAVTRLWRRARNLKQVPDSLRVSEAKALVGFRHLHVGWCRHTARLGVAGMQLDLGGIAKGYAADRVLVLLDARYGIRRAMLDAGGDLALGDPPLGKVGWDIALDSARVLSLSNCGIATSGKAFRFLEAPDGRRFSHIIDLRTGWGVVHPYNVTVIAPTATEADLLATAYSVSTTSSLDIATFIRKGSRYKLSRPARAGDKRVVFWLKDG